MRHLSQTLESLIRRGGGGEDIGPETSVELRRPIR